MKPPKEKKKYKPRKPSLRQIKAVKIAAENGGNISAAMREAGYAPSSAATPSKLTDTSSWPELVEQYLPEASLLKHHEGLLNSSRLDHMIFPLGPKDEDDINFSGGVNAPVDDDEESDDEDPIEEIKERTTLTDGEIIEMLAEVNCKVRRIVHGNSARHVYFWSPDNKARKEGLEMAYKIKGKYIEPKTPPPAGNTYNFFYQNNIRQISAKYEDDLEKAIEDNNAPKT